MRRHLAVGAIDDGIVEAGFMNARFFEVVGHDDLHATAEEGQRTDVRTDPVVQLLGPCHFRGCVVRSAEGPLSLNPCGCFGS
jgi:hypothetical protein